jgi:predicted DsbA family dithiol-disulfide isomerase
MLLSESGMVEVQSQIDRYRQLGIDAVPVIILEEQYPIYGYPDVNLLEGIFRKLIENGTLGPADLQ